MKVLEVVGMKPNVGFSRSQLLLYYLIKSLGSAPFVLKNNEFHPNGFFSKVYALSLLSSNIIMTITWSGIAQSFPADTLNRIMTTMLYFFFNAHVCAALLTFAFKSNKVIEMLNNISAVENELKSFDTQQTQTRYQKNIATKIIAINLIALVFKFIGVFTMGHKIGGGVIFVCFLWIATLMSFIQSYTAKMIFVESLLRLRRNFEFLNKQLQDVLRPNCQLLLTNDVRNSPIFPLGGQPRQFLVERFVRIRKLHRELCELVESTTSVMAFPLLLAGAYYVNELLWCCFFIYNAALKSSSVSTGIMTLVAQLGVAPIIVIMIESFLITDACSSTQLMANATNDVLIKVWNKFRPRDMRDEVFMFSFQLLHNPVHISTFGFLDLDYSFIYKMLCALVTYFVIVVQFDTSQPNAGP